jgi:predicted dehydrogenase
VTLKNIIFCLAIVLLLSCNEHKKYGLVVVDPGHFHAALVQKTMYPEIARDVFVYAPDGTELQEYLSKIEGYNSREENPTQWEEQILASSDFLAQMAAEKRGNVAVISGNNRKKTDYIETALSTGLNVLADKPMAINQEGFNRLLRCFEMADQSGLLLYDIMTERFEITSILQREFSRLPSIFGEQIAGSDEQPGIEMESVHLFLKTVSGKPLTRPAWFFDVAQQGEAIADVAVHLVDLVQWELFPEQAIDYRNDIEMLVSRHWTTALSKQQFAEVTSLSDFPDFLLPAVENDTLKVFANGSISYKIKGIYAKVDVRWDYTNAAGGDTHFSVLRGSRSSLVVKQGEAEGYQPTLYVLPNDLSDADFERDLYSAFSDIEKKYPGIALVKADGEGWQVVIPDSLRKGHEAHFAQVTENFLKYLKAGLLPDWEIPCMIAKYYVTTVALKKAVSK